MKKRRAKQGESFAEILARNERRHRPPLLTRLRRGFVTVRPFLLLAILLVLYAISNPAIVPPRGPLLAERQVIATGFTRCLAGRSAACVVDGDTIRIDGADVRLVGFNTPEFGDARCERERILAEQATIALHKLLNDGPVVLLRDRRDSVDRYGRALRTVMLIGEDGSEKPLADEMIALGLAEPYRGGGRRSWC